MQDVGLSAARSRSITVYYTLAAYQSDVCNHQIVPQPESNTGTIGHWLFPPMRGDWPLNGSFHKTLSTKNLSVRNRQSIPTRNAILILIIPTCGTNAFTFKGQVLSGYFYWWISTC